MDGVSAGGAEVRGRAYNDADRERARIAWESAGRSLRGAARETGIPLATIQGWAAVWENPPPAPLAPPEVYEAVYEDVRTSKKGEVIAAAWDLASAAFQRAKEALPNASARDAATVAGIAVDKAQLLSGDATERTEHNIKAILGILPPDIRAEVVRLAAGDGEP